jgi:predicted RNA-binding Zn ribbon-like protein
MTGFAMDTLKTFRSILIEVPREAIARRLGFRVGKTRVRQLQKEQMERAIQGALALIRLQGVLRRVRIEIKNDTVLLRDSGIIFKSKNLSQFLRGCNEMVLMAATSGNRVTEAIRKKSKGKEIETAVIWDAVASEMVDGALDWIQQYCNHSLLRENRQLSLNRYSCGYGDFLLENQKAFFDLLSLKRFGVRLTKSYMLVPEKSVTAIAAIKELR